MSTAPAAARSRSTSPAGQRLGLDPQESLGHFGDLGGALGDDGESPTSAKAASQPKGTCGPSMPQPTGPTDSPAGLSMSKLTSPVLVENRHGTADPASARSPRCNESAEAFLERHNVAAILEGFVAGVIATRPENVALFGAEFFASAVAITSVGARRLSNNPLVPHAPDGPPLGGSAGHAPPARVAQARVAGSYISPGLGADAAAPGVFSNSTSAVTTTTSGVSQPHHPHARGILSPASGQTPSDMSLQSSAAESRRGSEGLQLPGPAAAPKALLPTSLSTVAESSSPHNSGGHLPDVPEAMPSTGGRPNKRQLKRLFSAPPQDPPIAFDDRAPARRGNYGIVRRATWGDHGAVAVKQVTVQATWTLDELRHLKACQTDRLAGSLRLRNAGSPANTPGQPHIAPPALAGGAAGGGSPVVQSLGGAAATSTRATPLASSQRQHWDVVHCLAVFYDPDANSLWFVFEWIGETLAEAADALRSTLGFENLASHVAAGPGLRWQLESWTAGVVRQLLLALQHVHAHGKRVHLDVKPANVLVRRRVSKSVKVLAPADDAPVEPGSPGASSSGSHCVHKIAEPAGDAADEHDAPSAPSGAPPGSRVRRIREEVAATRSPFGEFGRSRSPGVSHAAMDFDVVLADFGTAQEIGTPLQQLGDFKYIAPEIYAACDIEVESGGVPAAALVKAGVPSTVSKDDQYRPSCDSWGVGCLVIYCLEGYAPFDLDEDAVFTALRACWMQPTTQHPRLWSPDLTNFLSLCFERDARLRPGADELLEHPWVRSSEAA